MNKIIIIVICNICVLTNAMSQCKIDEDKEINKVCHDTSQSEFTTIDALNFTTIKEGVLRVGGDVCISMGNQKVSTKELLYDDTKQLVTIDTPLIYTDGSQRIDAQSAELNLQDNKADMLDIQYVLNDTNANGRARQLKTENKISHLRDLTYSTCPKNDQQWYIQAETADLDQEAQVGTFRKMTLRFKGVPLLYLPYAKMPLSDQRQSGFLIPEIGNSSKNGFDFALPYYINIAENMDATITPRYLSKRGVMLGAEFRYLGENYAGEIYADYLPTDDIINRDRGFAEFKHRQRFNANWSLNSRLSNVSDRQYFEDFGNNINATSQSYLFSFLNLNGFGDNWQFSGRLNDFQIISDNISLNRQPYQTLPSLEYSWFNNDYTSSLNYGVDSAWVNFYREDSITSTRLDVTPYIEKTFQNNYSRFTPRLAYRHTNWDYSDEQFSTITDLQDSRSLPIVSLDYTINFEKRFTDGSYSSIEPRLFYLYSPFRNQQNIALFDTHELTFGSSLLYQTNAFSGADRQSDANQFSIGLSQRHFNETGNEKWNVTVGQIIYLADRKVQLNSSIETRNTSPIITEFNYFYRNWKATMSLHWDTEIDKYERALLKFQYKGKNKSLFNFAYRFRRGKIEQLDSSVVLPIGANNRFIARWNYSVDARKTIEAIAGFEHKNCCWATRIVARRYVFNEEGDVNNGIFFELQLNGLGAIGRNPRRLLNQSILGYSEEF
ncbi:MAG: LPS assembly protein LptD [Alcanivoracaceae bacterium]|nr:LPS assembly protein LptD [Alcanivoracaceae bacterium]